MRAAIYNGQRDILLTKLEAPVCGDNYRVDEGLFELIKICCWKESRLHGILAIGIAG